jgi:hypothetical protein
MSPARLSSVDAMEPISLLILAALGLFGGTASVAYVAYLTLPQVRAWFQARRAALFDRDAVAATLVDLLASGQYRTVQGIFNTRSRTWTDYRTIEGQLSPDLRALHRNKRVVYHVI